jgi:hypothetical protein
MPNIICATFRAFDPSDHIGLKGYFTLLLPQWMRPLADGRSTGLHRCRRQARIWKGADRSPNTAPPGLYLASSYAGSGGFTGAILAGAAAANQALANRIVTAQAPA